MTGEQFNDFDPVAAAEAYLGADAEYDTPALSEEELAVYQRFNKQQLAVSTALADHGIDLQLQESQTLENKSEAILDDVESVRSRWQALVAREQAGALLPGEYAKYTAYSEEMQRIQALGDLVDAARMISQCFPGEEAPELREGIIRATIATIVTSERMSSEQRAIFLHVLETTAGGEVFSKVLQQVQSGNDLEERAAVDATGQALALRLANERTAIQEMLIQDFGVDTINHEDWEPFVDSLHRLARVHRDGATAEILNRQFTKVYATAERLGIAMQTLSEVFARLDILT